MQFDRLFYILRIADTHDSVMIGDNHMNTDAYRVPCHEILHGRSVSDDRLQIADLNDLHRLGMTPVREALMRLASEGLGSRQSYCGAKVAGIDIEDIRDVARTHRQIRRLCLTQAIKLGDAVREAEIMRSFHLLKRTPCKPAIAARKSGDIGSPLAFNSLRSAAPRQGRESSRLNSRAMTRRY